MILVWSGLFCTFLILLNPSIPTNILSIQADDCENQIVAVEGQLTNKCLLIYGDDNATPTGSHMYACDNGKQLLVSFYFIFFCQFG